MALMDSIQQQPDSKRARQNLAVLASSSFLRGANSSIFTVVWQPFVLSLGASMPTLGLLNSIGGMGGIVTTLVQPLGGWFSDRLGRKPFIVASSLALIAGYALFAAAGWLNLWLLLVLGVILLGVSAISRPAISSMTAESVHTSSHGSAFSLMMLASVVPGILAPAVGGWVADRFGYVSVFPIGLALEAVGMALVWRYLGETIRPGLGGLNASEGARALVRSMVPPKGLVGFFCAVAGDSFSWGMGWGLIFGMATETFHLSVEQLGIMSSVTSISWAISQMPIGRYIDRHGTKGMLIFSEAIGIPLMLVWLTQSQFEVFLAAQVLFGLTAATWVPTVNTFLTRRVGESERAEAFGRLNAFRGLVAFPAPAIGGVLYAWGGLRLPLLANLIGIFAVMAILAKFVQEPRESEQLQSTAAMARGG